MSTSNAPMQGGWLHCDAVGTGGRMLIFKRRWRLGVKYDGELDRMVVQLSRDQLVVTL